MTDNDRLIAALYVRVDSHYKTMPRVDAWDVGRDARRWPGGMPVVAHPPCKRWSMLNAVVLARNPHKAAEFAWGNDGGAFEHALRCVREWGGVIEHPAQSRAWKHFDLPRIGHGPDSFGGYTMQVDQCDWGHRARKRTWLYIVGTPLDRIPSRPARGKPVALVSRMPDCRLYEIMSPAERERTSPAFAAWLVEVARRSRVQTVRVNSAGTGGGINDD